MDLRTAAEDIYDSRGDLQQFGVGFVGSSVWSPFLNFLKLRLCRPKGLGEWTKQGLPLHSELLGRIDRFEPYGC